MDVEWQREKKLGRDDGSMVKALAMQAASMRTAQVLRIHMNAEGVCCSPPAILVLGRELAHPWNKVEGLYQHVWFE